MKAEANIGGLLGKTSRMMSNALDAKLLPLGLTSQQWSLLAVLSTSGGRNQTELAKALLKTKASVGSLVNYLETKDCIMRKVSTTDRRETIVVLTAAGREVYAKSKPLVAEIIARATRGLEPDDLARTQITLNRIIENLKDLT